MSVEFAPLSNLDEAFVKYKQALSPVIEEAFGWDEKFQLERFRSRYELSWFSWVFIDGERVGFVCYYVKASDLHLSLLVIDPDKRDRGLGRRVMEHLQSLASRVTLSSFRNNYAAVRFYESLGYRIVGGDEHFVDLER